MIFVWRALFAILTLSMVCFSVPVALNVYLIFKVSKYLSEAEHDN